MKTLPYLWFLVASVATASAAPDFKTIADTRGRLFILADMGNEPDEEQQMMHMLMCSNEFDLEGLVAVTGKFLNPDSPRPEKQKLYPELFYHLIEGYEKVYENLQKHDPLYPEPAFLRSLVRTGQRRYGIQDVGSGKASPGSQLLIERGLADDPRPLYVVVNAGSNTLAQALFDLRETVSEEVLAAFVAKLRVFENGAQDNAGAWICHEFPGIHWVRSNYQAYCYGGPGGDGGFDNKGERTDLGPYTWKPYAYNGIGQHQWLLEHVIGNHGPFGAYYPLRQFPRGGISFMEGGGTIPWLCLINRGLSDIDHPEWGGWSGRYTAEPQVNIWSKHQSVKKDEDQFLPFYMRGEAADDWVEPETGKRFNPEFAPVFRWRQAFLNDFVCRMDWCRGAVEETNHSPQAVIWGDGSDSILVVEAVPGSSLRFDASGSSDPDGDPISIHWWQYREAGSYPGPVELSAKTGPSSELSVPENAAGTSIHIILEVRDGSAIAPLYDYRRIVVEVE